MQLSKPAITTFACLWVGSLAGAYFFGKGSSTAGGPSNSATTASGSSQTTLMENSKLGGNGKSTSNAAAKGQEGKQASSVKQILAKLTATMRTGGMQNPRAMMKAMALLDEIPADQIQNALAELENVKDPQTKMVVMMALLGRWAETDGPAAMAYADEHAKGMGMMSGVARMGAAAAWAEKDPEAVWKWYESKKESGEDTGGPMGGANMVLMTLFTQLANKDPEAAFKRLAGLEGSEKSMAMAGLMQTAMFDDEKRTTMLKFIDTLEPSEKATSRQMLISQWASMDPDAALAYAKTLPKDEQSQTTASVASVIMMQDPKRGAAMIMEGATEQDRGAKASQVISQWSHQDVNAAGTWLKEQPPGAYLDNAKQSFVYAAAEKDPGSAMVWVTTIEDQNTRVNAARVAYKAWHKKQPQEADQALGTLGLTEQQVTDLKGSVAAPAAPTTVPVQKF